MKALKTLDNWISGVAIADPKVFDDGDCKRLQEIANEIRDEVKRFYIPLPLDADGVPVNVGDVMMTEGERPFMVGELQFKISGWIVVRALDGIPWRTYHLHHVKSRTLEDLLRDYACDFADSSGPGYDEEITKRYAEEIRELLGVDE